MVNITDIVDSCPSSQKYSATKCQELMQQQIYKKQTASMQSYLELNKQNLVLLKGKEKMC